MDPCFPERSRLQVEDVVELLHICLTTAYFQFEDKFQQQKSGHGDEKLTVSGEHFEEIVLDTTDYKLTKWLICVDDTSVF
jgi:hypothetical protein